MNLVQKNIDKLSDEELKTSKWMPHNLYRRFEEYNSFNHIDNFAGAA
jgi:hypothetical protein